MNYQWTNWLPLNKQNVSSIPEEPGIYEICTDYEIKRLRGESIIVSIGRAVPNLKTRLSGRTDNAARYMNRCEKWLIRGNHKLEFHYLVVENAEEAKWLEALRHWQYENNHWELPPGNDRLEKAPIIKKIEGMIGKVDGGNLKRLFAKYRTVEDVASYLGVHQVVVENLKTYFLI